MLGFQPISTQGRFGHVPHAYAECTCLAGKAPFGSCKHLAAFLYALEEFSRCGYTWDLLTSTDELQAWNKPHRKKSEPMKLSEMSWAKSRSKSGKPKQKTKCEAEEHQDPRGMSERGQVNATLLTHLEDMESKCNGLFLVASDPLHAAREREARLLRQQHKQEEWSRMTRVKDGAQIDDAGGDDDEEEEDITPVPSDCEWMDTEMRKELNIKEWYEQNVNINETRAKAIFDATVDQSLSTECIGVVDGPAGRQPPDQ